MHVFRRKKFQRVESDKPVLCYRDTATGILFTWDCNPDSVIKIWHPNFADPQEVDITAAIKAQWAKDLEEGRVETNSPYWAWGTVVGMFWALVQDYLTPPADLVEISTRFQEIIKNYEKE